MAPVLLPDTLDALWRAMAAEPQARLFCGGTDVLVARRHDQEDRPLIGIERIAALRGIRRDGNDLVIGAATSFATILDDPMVAAHLPVLTRAVAALASPTIRAMASLGGNIVTASPAGDSLPALAVLGASVDLASADATRRLPLLEFITGPRQTALRPGEIVTATRVPLSPHPTLHHAEKVGQRRMLSGTLASLAAVLRLDSDRRVIEARLAFGTLGPTVLVCPAAEAALVGRPLSADSVRMAGEEIRRIARPRDDVRASAAYRLHLAGALLSRLLDPAALGPARPATERGPA